MPSEKDDKPKSRRGPRKKSPADIAAEAEAAAAAAEKSQRSSGLSEPAAEAPMQAERSSDRGAQDRSVQDPSAPERPLSRPDPKPEVKAEPPNKRQVESWLAARLAALDPGDDDEDISDPSTQVGKSTPLGRPLPQSRATGTPSSWPSQGPTNARSTAPARPGPLPSPTRAGHSRMETEVDEDGDPPTLSLADARLQGMILPEGMEVRPDLAPTLDLSTVPHAPEPVDPPVSPQGPSSQASSLEVMVVGATERTPPLPVPQEGGIPSVDLVDDEKTPIPQEAWPDFEPLSLPSEEIEPLDDAVPSDTVEPHDTRAPRLETPNRSEPPGDLARDDQTWDLLGESDGRGLPAFDEDPTRHDDERTGPGGWATQSTSFGALAGPGPARVMVGPGSAPPASSVVPFSTAPQPSASPNDPTLLRDEQDLAREEKAEPASEERSPPPRPPVIKSAAAPVRPRSPNEEARYDALIAEVAQKSESPTPRTDAPRRKPGPFSRWNEDADSSDPGDRRRLSSSPPLNQTVEAARYASQPETQTELKEPGSSEGLYDEMMFPPARGLPRGEETAALLADSVEPTSMPAPPPIPRIASPQSSALAAALRPLQESQNSPLSPLPTHSPAPERERHSDEDVEDPGSKTEWRPQKPVDLDKKPLADEKTEIRSFSPKIDTVGDDDDENAPTTRMGSHEERVPPITAADLPQTPPPSPREETHRRVGPMTWVWVGVGTVAFLSPLALIVIIAIWAMQ